MRPEHVKHSSSSFGLLKCVFILEGMCLGVTAEDVFSSKHAENKKKTENMSNRRVSDQLTFHLRFLHLFCAELAAMLVLLTFQASGRAPVAKTV